MNVDGFVSRVSAPLDLDPWVRDKKLQVAYNNIGRPRVYFNGDHLIARVFGPPPDRVNVALRDTTLNKRGFWRNSGVPLGGQPRCR